MIQNNETCRTVQPFFLIEEDPREEERRERERKKERDEKMKKRKKDENPFGFFELQSSEPFPQPRRI